MADKANKQKVVVIDEQPFFRAGVRQALSSSKNLEIIESDPNDKPLDLIEETLPDVVLLGSDLASHSGLELGRDIARRFPNTKVIMLSPDPNDEELFEVIRSSAVACLKKNTTATDLLNTIERATHGEYPINETVITHPQVAKQVLKQFQDLSTLGGNLESLVTPLTQREREILTFVANGNTNKQIALNLDISEQTIKNHVSAILRKLNANDRAHAVVLALRHGLINVEQLK